MVIIVTLHSDHSYRCAQLRTVERSVARLCTDGASVFGLAHLVCLAAAWWRSVSDGFLGNVRKLRCLQLPRHGAFVNGDGTITIKGFIVQVWRR
eukprot:6213311-Pleurochrysis_carterae.AAC.5